MFILLSGAYRLFFPAAGLFAALAVPLWVATYAGDIDGVQNSLLWHRHEMLFGYLPAALAGFLLTAIPNWTKRPPLAGAPLGLLFGLWLAGRIAMFTGAGEVWAHVISAIFLPVLLVIIAREIWLGGNKRNLIVCVMVALIATADWLFLMGHEALGLRLGFCVALMLMALIGGRVTPAFSRNWMKMRGLAPLPPQFGMVDKVALATTALVAISWSAAPDHIVTAALAIVAALALLARLSRWKTRQIMGEPLLLALHLSYLWLSVALAILAWSILAYGPQSAVFHALGAGAIGTLTLIVMMRAILGHSGRAIRGNIADWLTLSLVHIGAALRVAAAILPLPEHLMHMAGMIWALGFLIFTIRFLPVVLRRA